MATVLLLGATGFIGAYIARGLGAAGVNTTALVRDPDSRDEARQAKLGALRDAGVTLLRGSLEDAAKLERILKKFDTVVSCLPDGAHEDELKLLEACKQAGTIKRYFPSNWGGEYPLKGRHANALVAAKMSLIRSKEEKMEAVRRSGVPYTIVVNYSFYEWFLPCFGNAAPPGTPAPTKAPIYGDGNRRANACAEGDIAKVVARAVNDPRTANKKLTICSQAVTQKELLAIYEAATGKPLSRITVTNEDLEEQIKGAQGIMIFVNCLHKSIWVDGANELPPTYFTDDEVVTAAELYPDIKMTTIDDYYKSRA